MRPSDVAVIQGKLEIYRLKQIGRAKHGIRYLERVFFSVLFMDEQRLDIWDIKRRKVRKKYEESLETW